VHAASNVLQFKHGTSPGGTGNSDVHGTGAEFGMAGEKSFAASKENGGVAVVKSLDFEDGGGGKIVEEDSALDFGLNDCVVDVVG
jgi:hypothetical protein